MAIAVGPSPNRVSALTRIGARLTRAAPAASANSGRPGGPSTEALGRPVVALLPIPATTQRFLSVTATPAPFMFTKTVSRSGSVVIASR